MGVRAEAVAIDEADLIVVGAGAAGLAAAIFALRSNNTLRVRCVDGAHRVGAKILVSGGARCNLTNRDVTERDFCGGSPRFIRSVLRAFSASSTVRFFEELGVSVHEEEAGKLFPDSNSARTVLTALLDELRRLGGTLDTGRRITAVLRDDAGFRVTSADGREARTRAIVLATGGRSLPKSGSDGFGYELARSLGHGHVATTPALVPLTLAGDRFRALAGVSHAVSLTLRVDGAPAVRVDGPMLWTHFGASGPAALDLSRHWHRAHLQSAAVQVWVSLCPSDTFESIDAWLIEQARARPRARPAPVLAARLPAAVADLWCDSAGIPQHEPMAHLNRDARRRLAHAITATALDVTGSRGYAYAEVTAGGVPLEEVDPATMESRLCPGLYLVGEILDADGRLGGFNFQWAWSSGWVAGRAIARALAAPPASIGTGRWAHE